MMHMSVWLGETETGARELTQNDVWDLMGRRCSSLKALSLKISSESHASRRDAAHSHIFETGKSEQRSGAEGEGALEWEKGM